MSLTVISLRQLARLQRVRTERSTVWLLKKKINHRRKIKENVSFSSSLCTITSRIVILLRQLARLQRIRIERSTVWLLKKKINHRRKIKEYVSSSSSTRCVQLRHK